MNNPRLPESWRSPDLFETGFGYVIVSRFKKTGGIVEAGVFLVDVYCIGIRNAFFTRLSEEDYETKLLGKVFPGERVRLEPSCGRKLVEDSVAYAASLGLAPHPDYKEGARVFGGINPSECAVRFTFGRDGKPCYMQGANDTPERARMILNQLRIKCGEGNYLYVVGGDAENLDELMNR
jgi:hypothetical protein